MDTVLTLEYLPVNQAWLVLWNGQRIAGPMPADSVRGWLADHGIGLHEIEVPLWLRREWGKVSA